MSRKNYFHLKRDMMRIQRMPETNQHSCAGEKRQSTDPGFAETRRGSEFTFALSQILVILCLLVCYAGQCSVSCYSLKGCRVVFPENATNDMSVICVKGNLSVVPKDIPSLVVFLDISGNKMSQIKKNDFYNTSLLRSLNLRKNHISHVEDGSFANLPVLDNLNMGGNLLTNLSKHIFQGLNNSMLSLKLDGNWISSITNSSFESCSKLQQLDLSNNRLNKLEIIRHILQHTPGLHVLDIHDNTFKYFNSTDISNRSLALKSLDISQNPFKSFRLTSDIFPKLTTLNLYMCSQKDMIWDVQNKSFLQNVSKLDLGGGHMSLESMRAVLQTLNSSLTNLTLNDVGKALSPLITVACRIPTVTSLLVRNNRIATVPGDLLKSCGKLTSLDLSKNNIFNVSGSSFKALQQLASLKMSQNNLTSVPTVISNLTKLKTLDLSHNNIRQLGCSDFAHLTKLTVLFLFSNVISKLEACVFQDLNALEILMLGNNRIHSLGKVFKNSLPNLKCLDLTSNKLKHIKHNTFKNVHLLTHLNLGINLVNILDSGAFEGLINLKKLTLSQNLIDCGRQGIRQEVFSGLSNLIHLNMCDNKCQYKTDEQIKDPPFANLSSLQTLLIFSQHHREKSHLPPNFLEGLTNLSVLKARNIRITSLKPETFNHTPQLKYLEINANNLVNLDPELFHPIPNLEQLFVSTTELQSLDFLIHANLSQLRFLQARQNAFSIINETVLKSLPALTYLD